jgi:hypothetical protein
MIEFQLRGGVNGSCAVKHLTPVRPHRFIRIWV